MWAQNMQILAICINVCKMLARCCEMQALGSEMLVLGSDILAKARLDTMLRKARISAHTANNL